MALFLSLAHASCTPSGYSRPPRSVNGNTLVFDGQKVMRYNASTLPGLPQLPPGTVEWSHGPASADGFDGYLTLAGSLPLSLSKYFEYGIKIRRVMSIFADWLNIERGGLLVGCKRLAIRFLMVDDHSDTEQVMNATAVAYRKADADFAYGGYSSELTEYSSLQSDADGLMMMSGGASRESIFTHSKDDLLFSSYSGMSSKLRMVLEGIRQAAERIDAGKSNWTFASRCTNNGNGGCLESIVVGFIRDPALAAMCNSTIAHAQQFRVATGADGSDLVVELPSAPTEAQVLAALNTLRDANVNLVVGCMYHPHGDLLVDGLANLSWAPYAMALSSTIEFPGYAVRLKWPKHGYKNEYVLGWVDWHSSYKARGDFSNMTSDEFVQRYVERYERDYPTYDTVCNFGMLAALSRAVELAGTLEKHAVAAQLSTMQMQEFYGLMKYDADGLLDRRPFMLQILGNASADSLKTETEPVPTIVFPENGANAELQFPMPDWPVRRCYRTCDHDHGVCSIHGVCTCHDGFTGENCDLPLGPPAWMMPLMYAAAAVLGCAVLVGCAFGARLIRRHIRKAHEALRAEQARRQKKLDQALDTCDDIPHSCALISARDFIALGSLRPHEELRNRGLLMQHDKLIELTAAPQRIIFFSHQWTANGEPDHTGLQYATMVAAIDKVLYLRGWAMQNVWIWADYLSIPQASRGQQKLAIASLVGYASVAHAFVIAAPPVAHKDHKGVCDVATYNKRMWCRCENLAHSLRNGTANMYVATGPMPDECVRQADDLDFLNSNLRVFFGEATVEADKLSLVAAVLGLYAELYATAIHVYKHGSGGLPAGDPTVGSLLGRAETYDQPGAGSAGGTSAEPGGVPLDAGAPAMARKNLKKKKKKTGPSVVAMLANDLVLHDVRKQLDVLELIGKAQEEIFPRRITVKAPHWAPAPDETHELFGPLVGMMQDRLHADTALRKKLYHHAMLRKAAAAERNLLIVRRMARRWMKVVERRRAGGAEAPGEATEVDVGAVRISSAVCPE